MRVGFRWEAAEGNAILDTDEIAAVFGCKENQHVLLYGAIGIEYAAGAASRLTIMPDPRRENIDTVPAEYDLNANATSGASYLWRNGLYLRANTDAYSVQDYYVIPVQCRNQIAFFKSTGADWLIYIEYDLIEGGLDWRRENLEVIPDIKKVGQQTSAGNEFHQVGGYYQIGRREYG